MLIEYVHTFCKMIKIYIHTVISNDNKVHLYFMIVNNKSNKQIRLIEI